MEVLWIIVGTLVAIMVAISLIDLVRTRQWRSAAAVFAWALIIVLLPFIGSIAYWIRRTPSQDEIERQRLAEEDVRR
jgi:uncharacterized membrane protein